MCEYVPIVHQVVMVVGKRPIHKSQGQCSQVIYTMVRILEGGGLPVLMHRNRRLHPR